MSIVEGISGLLKLTGLCASIGLLSKLEYDLQIVGAIKKRWDNKLKIISAFPIDNEHVTVLGLTRHGKTYATMHTLKKINKGVLFFNVQEEDTPKEFIKADASNSFVQIKRLLKQGEKINYIPSTDIERASKELGILTDSLYNTGNLDFYFAIDECHLFCSLTKDKDGKRAMVRLATTGLRRGYKCLFLTQRPAMVDNTLYTQSTKHIVFALGKADEKYLKDYGFPVQEIVEKTKNEKYYFATFDQKEVKGAYKIG